MAAATMNDIKARMKSVKNTMQITKAMELVATSKLRRAKERAENSRPYQTALFEAISDIRTYSATAESVFAEKRENPKTCYIVVAGDRGLAGGFNNNVFKLTALLEEHIGGSSCYLPIGRKSLEHFSKPGNEIVSEEFSSLQSLGVSNALAIGKLVVTLFLENKIDRVEIVYTDFVSILSQVPDHKTLLPFAPLDENAVENAKMQRPYEPVYEGKPEEMLASIIPDYLGGSIYIAVCESFASECGARRTAMNSANKNASEMIDNLTLRYNRARQAIITQEITEIVSGAEAL